MFRKFLPELLKIFLQLAGGSLDSRLTFLLSAAAVNGLTEEHLQYGARNKLNEQAVKNVCHIEKTIKSSAGRSIQMLYSSTIENTVSVVTKKY